MRTLRHRKRAAFLVMAALAGMTAAPGSRGLACGYDDPLSISRGSLSWSYPDALYVMGAISREVAARRLPLANFDRPGVDLFGHKFRLAKTSLEQFGAMLGAASREPLQSPVAVVLVEPMLWARFEPTADGLRTAVHVSSAEHGDLVIVTGEAVIAEIAARHLTFGEAYARGVARLYGRMPRLPHSSKTTSELARTQAPSNQGCSMTPTPKRVGRSSPGRGYTRLMPSATPRCGRRSARSGSHT